MECGLKSSFREFKRMGEDEIEMATIENLCAIFPQKETEKWGTS